MPPSVHPKPLRASTFLLRNAGKSTPLVAVIVLAVMLIAGVVSLMNSIPYSIRTIYAQSRHYLGLTPRGDALMTPLLIARLQESPVPVERLMVARAVEFEVRSIVGPWPFVVLGLEQADLTYYLDRVTPEARLEGRLPGAGQPEVVLSEPIARNLGLQVGDLVLGPEKREAYSPNEVRLVGIVHSPEWIALGSVEYMREHHFPPVDVLLAFAADLSSQDGLDRWAVEAFQGERARTFAFHKLNEQTDEMFAILYRILDTVVGLLVVVITLMVAMLMNIYQTQRVQEFGLLQAMGYTRAAILRRLLGESALVVTVGWLLGVLMAYLLLNIIKATLMAPRAFAINTTDLLAYSYTIPVPIAIFVVASAVLMLRLRRFDPIATIERRLV